MAAPSGRTYSRYNKLARFFRVLGIAALVIVVLFFYLYFQWKKYIVYTGNGLYLDIPALRGADGGADVVRAGFDESQSEDVTAPVETDDGEGADEAAEPEDGAEPESESESGEEGNEPEDSELPGEGDTAEPEPENGSVPENAGEPENTPEPEPEEDSGTDKNGVRNSF